MRRFAGYVEQVHKGPWGLRAGREPSLACWAFPRTCTPDLHLPPSPRFCPIPLLQFDTLLDSLTVEEMLM